MGCHGNYNDIKIEAAAAAAPHSRAQLCSLRACPSLKPGAARKITPVSRNKRSVCAGRRGCLFKPSFAEEKQRQRGGSSAGLLPPKVELSNSVQFPGWGGAERGNGVQVAGIWEGGRERIGPCPERTPGAGKTGQTCGL